MKTYTKLITIVLATIISFSLPAAEIGAFNIFNAGTPAMANDVNENFVSIKTAVNDNNTRIANNVTAINGINAVTSNNTNAAAANNNGIGTNTTNISANTDFISSVNSNVTAIEATASNSAANITTNTSNVSTNASNISINTAVVDANALAITSLQSASTVVGTLKAVDGADQEIGTVISMNIGNPNGTGDITSASVSILTSKGFIRPNINMYTGMTNNIVAGTRNTYYFAADCWGVEYTTAMNGLVFSVYGRTTMYYTKRELKPQKFKPGSKKIGMFDGTTTCSNITNVATRDFYRIFPNDVTKTGVDDIDTGITLPITFAVR